MNYTIKAKPTVYGPTRFRSRLEARWAALFDLLGWEYVYEPFDLDFWAPDFLLLGSCNVLVEVKPILAFDPAVADRMERSMLRWLGEARRDNPGEPLLLGAHPFMRHEDSLCMGWCAEVRHGEEYPWWDFKGWQFWWSGAVPGIWGDRNPSGVFGYCHAFGGFNDRITGGYDGGRHGDGDYELHVEEFRSLWAQAGNLTQWFAEGQTP